jgi:hypothetical protein
MFFGARDSDRQRRGTGSDGEKRLESLAQAGRKGISGDFRKLATGVVTRQVGGPCTRHSGSLQVGRDETCLEYQSLCDLAITSNWTYYGMLRD